MKHKRQEIQQTKQTWLIMTNQSRCTKYIENVEIQIRTKFHIKAYSVHVKRGRTNPHQCLNNVKNNEDPFKWPYQGINQTILVIHHEKTNQQTYQCQHYT